MEPLHTNPLSMSEEIQQETELSAQEVAPQEEVKQEVNPEVQPGGEAAPAQIEEVVLEKQPESEAAE